MCRATLGAAPVKACTWAASAIFSYGSRGTPCWANTLNLVPELPKAHDGSSMLEIADARRRPVLVVSSSLSPRSVCAAHGRWNTSSSGSHLLVGRRRRRPRSTAPSAPASARSPARPASRRPPRRGCPASRSSRTACRRRRGTTSSCASRSGCSASRISGHTAAWWRAVLVEQLGAHLQPEGDPVHRRLASVIGRIRALRGIRPDQRTRPRSAPVSAADVGLVVHGERAHHDAQALRHGSGPSRSCSPPCGRR